MEKAALGQEEKGPSVPSCPQIGEKAALSSEPREASAQKEEEVWALSSTEAAAAEGFQVNLET